MKTYLSTIILAMIVELHWLNLMARLSSIVKQSTNNVEDKNEETGGVIFWVSIFGTKIIGHFKIVDSLKLNVV